MSEQIKKELPSNPDQDASTVDGYIPEIGTIIPENAPTIHDKSAFTSENAPGIHESSSFTPEVSAQAEQSESAQLEDHSTAAPLSLEDTPLDNSVTTPNALPDRDDVPSDINSSIDASQCKPIEMGAMAPSLSNSAANPGTSQVKPQRGGRFKQAWRERRVFMILSSTFLLLAILALSGIAYVYLVIHPYGSYDKILPNVYCAGINLGGMTTTEAKSAIEDALRHPSYSIKVILPDCEYFFCPEQEGVTLNGTEVAQIAYEYGRSDTSAYAVYRAYHNAKNTEYRLDAKTDLLYSQEDIQALANQIYEDTYIAPTEATAFHDETTHIATLTLGEPGRKIEPQNIVDAVCEAFDNMVFDDITLSYEKVEIDMVAVRRLINQCRSDYSSDPVDPIIVPNPDTHAIDLSMGVQGWKLNGNALYALARDAVERESYGTVSLALEPIEPTEVDITAAYSELACSPTEPYYYAGSVYEGSYGYTLDWEMAITQILDSTYGQSLSIAMTPIAPKHTAEEVRAVLFRDQLSSYSTAHTANSNRTHNLSLACDAINGTVINPGETFSFNNIVGERTADKGYRDAIVYVGTESKDELGGGICQVSSTIYNAALYAEMEITSRACHTFFVTYVPGGLDATVYWGSLDFCFRNNTEYPIRVNASVSGGYVNISIDGTKTNDHVVQLSSTRLSSTPYKTVYEEDSSKPNGYRKETTSPYTGYTYEAYQYIYDGNGNLLDTIYLGKSSYDKRDQVITIGTG